MTLKNTRLARRLGWTAVLVGLAMVLSANPASAQNMAFGIGSIYTTSPPTSFNGTTYNLTNRVVVYDLPSTGLYAAVAGPTGVDGGIDVYATVAAPGTRNAAAFGVIMKVDTGGTGLRFNIPTDPNFNLSPVINTTAHPQNTGMTERTGNLDAPSQPAGGQSIGIVGIHPTPGANIAVANNQGLFTIPLDVDPNLTDPVTRIKEYNLVFVADDEFVGFVDTAQTHLTTSGTFPHLGTTVQVRRSRPGDLNGNGQVNSFDIPGFISAVANVGTYQSANPWLRVQYIADMNANGAVNSFDIPGLITAITAGSPDAPAGSPSAVPEPSSVLLVFPALLAAAAYRRKLVRQRNA